MFKHIDMQADKYMKRLNFWNVIVHELNAGRNIIVVFAYRRLSSLILGGEQL